LIIELKTYDGTEVDVTNAVVGPGQEILIAQALIPGTTYFVGVRSYDGTVGAYTLCISQLGSGNVNTSTANPLNGCSTFKTAYTGATNYTVDFVPISPSVGGSSITVTGAFSLGLPALNLYPGNTYTVTVTSNYIGFTDGAGNILPTLSLVDQTPAILTIANHDDIQVKASQRCDAPATLLKGSVVRTEPYVCGVTNYTIRYTPAADCAGTVNGAPFERTQTSRFLSLNFDGSDTSPLGQTIQAQTYYIVEIRPNFGPGGSFPGIFWTGRVIFIGGVAMEESNASVEAILEQPTHAEIFPNPGNGQHVMVDYDVTDERAVDVRIVDAMGRQVWTGRQVWIGQGTAELQFESVLAKGIYMIEMSSEDFRETIRWVVE
jgi:hypothetical protein